MKQYNYQLNSLKVTFISLLLIATSPVRAEIKVVTTTVSYTHLTLPTILLV